MNVPFFQHIERGKTTRHTSLSIASSSTFSFHECQEAEANM